MRKNQNEGKRPPIDPFDIAGSDPELLNSRRIPDPRPHHTPFFRWLAKILMAVETRLRARGDRALRGGIKAGWVVLGLVGLLLLVGPIINKPLDFDEVIDSAALSEVDWVARDATIDYLVDRADDGTFTAEVSESYTADFLNGPEGSVEREIVTEFRGHDVEFDLHEVTVDGEAAEVTVSKHPTTTTIRLTRADGSDFDGAPRINVNYELHHLVSHETDEATGRPIDELSWPLFAPTWPQATTGIDVSLTLADEVNEALVRAPRAHVGWLLISETVWLTPDAETAQGVRYAFSNDDTLPPNADVWINASFAPGTFELPPKTTLFWVQTYGPLVPLLLLGMLLLFAIAARRIVWADSAGDAWYLPRSTPADASPELAARLLERPRHGELIDALTATPNGLKGTGDDHVTGRRTSWLSAVAHAGQRAGRAGSVLSAWRRASRWSADDAVVEQRLRWVPDSYVRDTFRFASIAITLLQWGILRQLSEQVILSIVWWPFAFVCVSTLLALITLWVVQRPRPLTREGALLMQQLRGIDAFARSTRLLRRGPVDDSLVPYAVLFERPRRAGSAVVRLAAQEAGDPNLGRGWRTEHFVSIPALLACAAAASIVAGAVVVAATQPAPYSNDSDHVSRFGELPGTPLTQVEGFEIEATLDRDEHNGARLQVTERNTVHFDDGGRVPQFVREWPSARFGQSMAPTVDAVRVDGDEVAFREIAQSESLAVVTQLEDVLSGNHEIEFDYTLSSPVVDATVGSDATQQLRWTALYSFWNDDFYTTPSRPSQGTAPVRPIRIQLTVAPDLVSEIRAGGWIGHDQDHGRTPHESGNWYQPWVSENRAYDEDRQAYELKIGSATTDDSGALIVAIDVDEIQSRKIDVNGDGGSFRVDPQVNSWLTKHDMNLTSDLGVRLDFAPETFSGVDPEAYGRYQFRYHLPYALLLGLAGLVTAASIGTMMTALRSRRIASASLATIAYAAIPIAAIGQCVLFSWAVMSMSGSDARGGAAFALGGVMLVAVITQATVVARRRPRRSRVRSGRATPQSRVRQRTSDSKGE